MASEFQTISEKILQLASLAQQLRLENAELRLRAASLQAENVDMSSKMQAARQRVAALLDRYQINESATEEAQP